MVLVRASKPLAAERLWWHRKLASGHDAQVENPAGLADLLLAAV